MLGEDLSGLCSAYGTLATTNLMVWQAVGAMGRKADDVRITGNFMRITGAKRSSKPEGTFERKSTSGEFSNRKLVIILYTLCY
jgi:hypothetical protein